VGTDTRDRRIIFMHAHGSDQILCDLPFESYEPGDIKETKERLAEELNCSPKEIEVRITGLKEQPDDKKNGPRLRIVNSGTQK